MCVLVVNFLLGGRQAGTGAEMERQGDQICQRNQGWKDGDGKTCKDKHAASMGNLKNGAQLKWAMQS